MCFFFFFQAEDGIRDAQESRGLGDVYKRQVYSRSTAKNRTIQSSDSMLRGLFPNTTDFYPVIFGQELADDMLLLSDNWAAISLRLSANDLYNADIITAKRKELFPHCLLYTSDAADEEDSVDLGGRRIIQTTNSE
eukprot:TRINITY_DN43839_c0_g1_i1.p2 TRINITY_DN43839_c0_g1~~TRINITY_DN43839_c0_g1_i1.p2  ORF type:complete len:136 (+),score=54.57 TRINITY_DN43839_c0_g1_i1:82-489(+)